VAISYPSGEVRHRKHHESVDVQLDRVRGGVTTHSHAEANQRKTQTPKPEAATIEAVRFTVSGADPLRSTSGVLLADELYRVVGRTLTTRNIDDHGGVNCPKAPGMRPLRSDPARGPRRARATKP
jgi:hypothetical protein